MKMTPNMKTKKTLRHPKKEDKPKNKDDSPKNEVNPKMKMFTFSWGEGKI